MDFALSTREEILKEIGSRFRSQRLLQGITQKNLAGMAGVSTGTIKALENTGITSFETIIRVTQALGLTDDLQPVFEIKPLSIAAMTQSANAKRQRAPRRKPACKP
jgi:transcriptional regulator with XRE-family HTH domain